MDTNPIYPEFVRRVLDSTIGDVTGETWSAQAIGAGVAFDPADVFLAAIIASAVGDPVVLPSIAISLATPPFIDITCDDDPALILANIPATTDVERLAVYLDTGSSATSRLVVLFNTRADSSPISLVADGTDLALTFPFGYVLRSVAGAAD